MNKITPEAVAKHAEEWPAWTHDDITYGRWRFVPYNGADPFLAVVAAEPCGFFDRNGEEITVWSNGVAVDPSALSGTWTPVRPDGSDLPDERAMGRLQAMLGKRPESLASGVHALLRKLANQRLDSLIDVTTKAREKGRAEERAAIMAGIKDLVQEKRAKSDASVAEVYCFGFEDVVSRLKAGEWSVK